MPSVLDPPTDQTERPSEHPEPPPLQSAAALVGGIVGDLKSLIEQQLQLTRMQIESELRQRIAAMGPPKPRPGSIWTTRKIRRKYQARTRFLWISLQLLGIWMAFLRREAKIRIFGLFLSLLPFEATQR